VGNPTYFDAANRQIDEILIDIESDGMLAWQDYLNDDLDTVLVPFGVDPAPPLDQEVHAASASCTYYYGFVNNKPPFDDMRVRKAFALATDKYSIVQMLGGGQIVAGHFAPPGVFGAPEAGDVGLLYDIGAAQASLQNYLDEKEMTLADFNAQDITLMYNTSAGHEAIANIIEQSWQTTLGVSVTVTDTEWTTLLDIINPHAPLSEAPHIFRMGWCGDYPDAHNFIRAVFNVDIGANRVRRGCNDEECFDTYLQPFDTLTNQAAVEPDPVTRESLYRQAEIELAEEEVAYLPLYFYANRFATKPYLARTFPVMNSLADISDWHINQVTAVIDPAGGTLVSMDESTSITIPGGVLTDTAKLSYTPAVGIPPAGDLASIGHVFAISVVYTDTGQAVILQPGDTWNFSFTYNDSALSTLIEATLSLYTWDGEQWVLEPSSSVNTQTNTLTASPGHFSTWAVFADTRRIYLPILKR
jgi:hypothetical protein